MTLEDIEQMEIRSEMAESVTLPVIKFKELLRLAKLGLEIKEVQDEN